MKDISKNVLLHKNSEKLDKIQIDHKLSATIKMRRPSTVNVNKQRSQTALKKYKM
jgi:hypothetical protein